MTKKPQEQTNKKMFNIAKTCIKYVYIIHLVINLYFCGYTLYYFHLLMRYQYTL